MDGVLRIGEYTSLGTLPYFFPLRKVFNEPNWQFVSGQPDELSSALSRGEVDVALVPPLTVAGKPFDYLVLSDLGYAGNGHIKDALLFSDMLLDDMDEMTLSLPEGSSTISGMIHVVLDRYLQYQNEFIMGWGNAEAFLLSGDSALRERILARYSYVYDVGDLWRHYTGKPMIYYLWIIKKRAMRKKKKLIIQFHRLLKQSLEVSRSDWSRIASLAEGYDWVKKPMFNQVWKKVEYDLSPGHFEGLNRFYEDCIEVGIIEDIPELEFFEHD
jgi:chorismate dehydratase